MPNQTIQEPLYPVTSIDSIEYIDCDATTGASTTVDPSLYTVDLAAGRVAPAANQQWPAAKNQLNSVVIQFHAGFPPGEVPSALQQAILNHCLLSYMNPGGLPAAEKKALDDAIISNRQILLV